MDHLIDEMIDQRIKPFCRLQSNFHHIACIFKDKKFDNRLSFGSNSFYHHQHSTQPYRKSIHAEVDAIYKLQNNNNNVKKINIMVIRITKTGKLCNSKPCEQCIRDLKILVPKKGYKLEWIFYSDSNGQINRMKLHNIH